MGTLYELSEEYIQLLAMAEDEDIDEQCLHDTMEAIEGELEDKAEKYAIVISTLEGKADMLDKEAKRLSGMISTYRKNAKKMKEALQATMELTGKMKFKTNLYSFGVQKNPPSLMLVPGAEIPEEYMIAQEPKIDTVSIKKALKDGADFDFAQLVQSQSLRIR